MKTAIRVLGGICTGALICLNMARAALPLSEEALDRQASGKIAKNIVDTIGNGALTQPTLGTKAKVANVFGRDTRRRITSYRDYFWPIVRVETENGGCTGSIVGKNLVLTAAHCIMKNGALSQKVIYVKTGYVNGKYADKTHAVWAWWGTTTPEKDRLADWAILKLKKNLGNTFGTFGFLHDLSEFSQYNDKVSLAGFSSDISNGHVLSRTRNCSIRYHYSNGMLLHDCDATRGTSGGPVYKCPSSGGCYIVCLAVSEYRGGKERSLYLRNYSHERANICLHPKLWAPTVLQLRGK